jgi:FKBP-type peptidyl-prolyl cis-trans isomerase SlpA
MPDDVPVGPGVEVTLTFTLRLPAGDVIDGTGETPATFQVGDGKLLAGFERAMFGLRPGERATLEIAAADGFGPANSENVQYIQRDRFPANMDIAEGLMFSFSEDAGSELPGVVEKVLDRAVVVNFNHPLAGRDLVFEVAIVATRQMTDDILRVKG